MTSVENFLVPDEELVFWWETPVGYFPLPIENIAENMQRAEETVGELAPPELKSSVGPVVAALTDLLLELSSRNLVYAGVGRHLSPIDESVVTSTLILTVQATGPVQNPRLVLKEFLNRKAEAGEKAEITKVDFEADRPVIFFEQVKSYPSPEFPGQQPPPPGASSDVYQIEVLIPSKDGRKMAVVEFATPFVSHGPAYRTMVAQVANSITFEQPAEPTSGGRSIMDALGG
ncbi:hypothetical protein D5S17_34685 [Pseudonocardiaceae bacterium YIM PH 21723]|nr:hypothetical protein D5S17_34685 [Pseudonocardiaceae bacterium YIM PH 21723]